MKIICVDNFARESKSDELVCTDINEYYGKLLVSYLNEQFSGDYAPDYYKLVPDDYKLYKFIP